jgi:hypothetical protein
MKTILKAALISTISFAVITNVLYKEVETTETTEEIQPEVKVDTPKTVNIAGKKILFIGDSHTAYAGGWQDRLCKRTGATPVNTAVGGKRTDWMLQQAQTKLASEYEYCFIWGGANDAASYMYIHESVKNIQHIVDLCDKKGVQAVVLTGFSPKTCIDVTKQPEVWKRYPIKYQALQDSILAQVRGCRIVQNHFISRQDGDCGDFICHMSASGHRKTADSLIKVLNLKTVN